MKSAFEIPIGTRTLILSKLYYGVLTKKLSNLDTERYFSILYYIQNNNGCCQQDICNDLYIDKTAMVKVLDALMKAGLIERKTDTKDRRRHYMVLSKKGISQTQEIANTFKTLDQSLFRNVSEKNAETFKLVLDQLTENLRDIPKDDLFFNYKNTMKPAKASAKK